MKFKVIIFYNLIIQVILIFVHAEAEEKRSLRFAHSHISDESCQYNKHMISNTKFSDSKCIDGSPVAFYLKKGKGSGAGKFHIAFEGGGWCWDRDSCSRRSDTVLGSSKDYDSCLTSKSYTPGPLSHKDSNPLFNWNTILVKYCSGDSWSGNADVQHKGKTLHFQGKHNRDAIITTLLDEYGLNDYGKYLKNLI